MQSVAESFKEANANVIIGAVVNWAITLTVLPAFNPTNMTFTKSVIITFVYAAVSIIRSYTIRRLFNKKILKKLPEGVLYTALESDVLGGRSSFETIRREYGLTSYEMLQFLEKKRIYRCFACDTVNILDEGSINYTGPVNLCPTCRATDTYAEV